MIGGVHMSAALGRITPGEIDVVGVPRGGCHGKRPALLMHGQTGVATDWSDSENDPGSFAIAHGLCRLGLVVIAGYWGGPIWGNDVADADMEAARTLAGTYGAATDKVLMVGKSMGALEALAFAAQYPTEVAAGVCLIPAVNMGDIRDNDRASARGYINTAFGLAAGSTSATVPLPSNADPYDNANANRITAPFEFFGSSADSVVGWDHTADFGYTVQMAAKLGAPATSVSGAGHTEATIAAAPVDDICRFLFAAA